MLQLFFVFRFSNIDHLVLPGLMGVTDFPGLSLRGVLGFLDILGLLCLLGVPVKYS